MANLDASIKSANSRCHDGGRITLNEHPVRTLSAQDRLKLSEHGRGHLRWGLCPLHEVEIVVGYNVEEGQHLIKHMPMLGRGTDTADNSAGVPRQFVDHWRHLDSFRACSYH